MAGDRDVVWAPRAKQDLIDVWHYYARVASPDIADNILRGIDRAAEVIGRSALTPRTRDDLMPGLRSAIVSPHTIFYRLHDGNVEVVRVLHQRRDLPAVFNQHPNVRRAERQ